MHNSRSNHVGKNIIIMNHVIIEFNANASHVFCINWIPAIFLNMTLESNILILHKDLCKNVRGMKWTGEKTQGPETFLRVEL